MSELYAAVTARGLSGQMACGQALYEYTVNTLQEAGIETVIYWEQGELSKADALLVIPGNMPFLTAETMKELISRHREGTYALTELQSLNEDGIGTPVGAYLLAGTLDWSAGPEEAYRNAKKQGLSCGCVYLQEDLEGLSIETMQDLVYCRKQLQQRINEEHMERGVDLLDPDTAYIGAKVRIGAGSVMEPNVILDGETIIGENTTVGMGSKLMNVKIGNGVSIQSSVLIQSVVEDGARIGPFAYLRPGSRIGKNAKIGDFVEIKNSVIGEKTSVAHLTYIGDSDVGGQVNFGCGCVTVNYDGKKKYRCKVGDHSFIGCNTNLVAPVQVGEGAYIAAGSTITDEVPEGALAIARARQVNKEHWENDRRK
jgi:bifunctional N-acetylglucosamine-1-phosphate-uridyltransferase/glucosamine-1-phosphate-acetyltransferase GlmU-like protein